MTDAEKPTIRVAAASIVRDDGHVLLVRKRGTTAFMQAGGKIDAGEGPVDALVRELGEELHLTVSAQDLEFLGTFTAGAANEPGHDVEAKIFLLRLKGRPVEVGQEIEELRWVDPADPGDLPLAPLATRHALPMIAGMNVRTAARGVRATSFGQESAAYERGRPDYPAEAVAWLLPGHARTVADVGAGTGKLTGAIGATGRTVIAVDPDAGMLEALGRRLPGVQALEGTGEHLPFPDGAVDAVTFGQAWHWVDVPAASREVGRVLAPGGGLGLIWNIRDERAAWVRELTGVMYGSRAETLLAEGGPTVAAPFGPLERAAFPWSRRMTVDDVLAMARSRSHLITASDADRSRILDGIRDLIATHPDTAGREHVDMPYVTHSFRATRP